MTSETNMVIPESKRVENLIWLRSKIGQSIIEFADLINMDPIDIFALENPALTDIDVDKSHMINVADYFTISLYDLFYTDLRQQNGIKDTWLKELAEERKGGKKASRAEFNRQIIEGDYFLTDESTMEDALKASLSNMHQICKLKNRYLNLRINGVIDRMDFFE